MKIPEKAGLITIVGLGGSGSRVAEGLVRMGAGSIDSPLLFCDGDKFASHNTMNQLVTPKYVGHKKVYAVADQLCAINPNLYVDAIDRYITDTVPLSGIVFLCIDSMLSRKVIMETCLENNPEVKCVIDVRMDSGVGCSYCFNPNNAKHQDCWWLYWHSDEETENTYGCQGQQPVIGAIFGTAMLALKQFEQYLKRETALGINNRVYNDFDAGYSKADIWPT